MKSALPKDGIYKYRDCFSVNWKQNGEAMFHQACWERLLWASERRKRKRMEQHPEPILIQMECEKVSIVNDDLKHETKVITSFLCNVQFCLQFINVSIFIKFMNDLNAKIGLQV